MNRYLSLLIAVNRAQHPPAPLPPLIERGNGQRSNTTGAENTDSRRFSNSPKGFETYHCSIPSNIKNELSEAEGLLFKGRQLIIPKAMQTNILDLIHESHLGIEKCKARARSTVYWPGMSRDIHDTVAKCATWLTHRYKNQKEPMIPHSITDRPWQKLGSDVFEHKGKPYLVVVDYYSKFIETSLMRDKTAGTIVTHMKSIFARHGIPEELVSDNMPYNSKEFKQFATDWGFKVTTSSPTYPQSNGLSEKAVQTVKRILKKTNDPYIGLLEYQNTPVTGMAYSPSQLLMSRATRTKIPVAQELLRPQVATGVQNTTRCLSTAPSSLLQPRSQTSNSTKTPGSCSSTKRKHLGTCLGQRESGNPTIILRHNSNWTAISPQSQRSVADRRVSPYHISTP